ncbi:MAG: hypothetical protein L3J89_09980 [Gammaproteobacteria bacterium]|nr:hypothetical protein [Gammaproteobacteria bacterium]
MNEKLLQIYALSVSFVSLGCLSIFSGIFLYNAVEVSFPSTMNTQIMHYPPQFSNHGVMNINPVIPIVAGQPLRPPPVQKSIASDDERNKLIQENNKRNLEMAGKRMKTESIMSMVRSFIIVLIASVVFFFHWRMAKRARA